MMAEYTQRFWKGYCRKQSVVELNQDGCLRKSFAEEGVRWNFPMASSGKLWFV